MFLQEKKFLVNSLFIITFSIIWIYVKGGE